MVSTRQHGRAFSIYRQTKSRILRLCVILEFRARSHDTQRYYVALVTHPHHNYYAGRAKADVASGLAYFLRARSAGFRLAQEEETQASRVASGFPTQQHG